MATSPTCGRTLQTRRSCRRFRPSAVGRRLIALVRAYLSPAPLAVLDEATCHLDPEAERRAEEAFAARGTLVVVAHRISSALRARRILILDGNRAVLGNHPGLLRESALYRDLLGHWTAPAAAGAAGPQIQPASRAILIASIRLRAPVLVRVRER